MAIRLEKQKFNEHSNSLTNGEMFARLEQLMHDKSFLIEIAFEADLAYRESQIGLIAKEAVPDWLKTPLFSEEERAVLISGLFGDKTGKQQLYDNAQQKLATGLGGFYALSEGLGIIAKANPSNPYQVSDTLSAIVSGSESLAETDMMCRLAHATWAAAQPFRNREIRGLMKPWDLLPEDEKLKDMVQIRASAIVLAARFTPSS